MKISCGIDIEKISRFEKYTKADFKRLLKIFTSDELEYCFSKKESAKHLCARFCAKEATVKALCSHGLKKPRLAEIEVVKISELPKINVFGVENVNFSLSLSHCDDYACANVIIY